MIVALAIPFALLFGAMFLLMYSHTASAHQGSSVDKKKASGVWGLAWNYFTITNPIAAGIRDTVGFIIGNARGWVSHWALAAVKPVARFFDGLTELFNRTYTENTAVATDTRDALQRMRHVVIPREIAAGVKPVGKLAAHASTTATGAATRVGALSTSVSTARAKQAKLNVHYSHAIDVAIPKQLGRINTRVGRAEGKIARDEGRIGELEDGAAKTWEWIRTHPLTAVTGAFSAAVGIALSRLGWGVLRCRSWQNLGRSLKCSDANVLRDLLIGATAIALSTDLVALAKAEQEVVSDLTTVVREFWQV